MLKIYFGIYLIYRVLTTEPDVIKPEDLREEVIRPTLIALAEFDERLGSDASIELLMGTAATESLLGYNLVQDGGPALGIYQMEPETYVDIRRYLSRQENEDLKDIVDSFASTPEPREMVHNLRFATAMARIRYWYVPESLPEELELQAIYYKEYYNTSSGAGTPAKYMADHEKYIGDR